MFKHEEGWEKMAMLVGSGLRCHHLGAHQEMLLKALFKTLPERGDNLMMEQRQFFCNNYFKNYGIKTMR